MRRTGPGSPEPLGVTLMPGGANVAVFSANATAIELCLFDAAGAAVRERIDLPERTGDVFHGFIPGVAAGDRYGLRAHGPYDPRNGHRFNPAKLLVDPYARAIDRRFTLHPSMFGANDRDEARDDTDSAAFVPKAIVGTRAEPAAEATSLRRPRVPWSETILYELHVRGFTRMHPGVPEPLRGTCAGLAHPAAIAHLTRLGVTTLELMPIAAAIDERHLARLGLTNYWGYNPVAPFVPDPRLAPGGIDELRRCVAALHAAGLEVILDVVLNHTGEGDEHGPTLSLRGLDNATYYRLPAGAPSRYVDDTGCGNTLALDRAPALRLAMDVLRHYAEATGVDGFRFDLATTLGRRASGFDAEAPLLQAIAQDPVLRELKLIAEPWDVGAGGHRLGAFPPDWGEWNDRYRDTARRYWRGDGAQAGDLATRFAGSSDIFSARARPPSRSINFVAAHDGFTLADLVAYAAKHNEANGEGNRDGSDSNWSWNHGVEGPVADAAIEAERRRDVRNLLATLLLSRGTPMLAMGDELGRTQRGNNNGYAQDSTLTWIDWARADAELTSLVAALVDLRKRHPALRDDRWLTGLPADGNAIADVEWRRPDGAEMNAEDWAATANRTLIASLYTPATEATDADRVAVALHAGALPATVRWPEAREGFAWRVCIDTSRPGDAARPGAFVVDGETSIEARSVVVVAEERDSAPRGRRAVVTPEMLDRLAAAAGIADDWRDTSGMRHVVTADTKRALLSAMGQDAGSPGEVRSRLVELANARERRPLPAVVVAREGSAATLALVMRDRRRARYAALRLRLEDGSVQDLRIHPDELPARRVIATDGRAVTQRLLSVPPLPAGCHTLIAEGEPDARCRVIVTPGRCFLPQALRAGARRFGIAAHLYSLRRSGDQGIGDFTALSTLAVSTARAGGSVVGINPLHALFARDRERASPYNPSDRRFLDPIYIDVSAVPDFPASTDAHAVLERNGRRLAALSAESSVDYAAVWQIKRDVLDACFARFQRRAAPDPLLADFERFVADGGEALRLFALFEAIAAAHPAEPWLRWPSALRRPDDPAVADFAAGHPRPVRFALYLQWQADRQLAAAAREARAGGLSIGLFRDLAVGAAPDGAEPWANPGAFAQRVSIGAPPDPFSPSGQFWNLPPPNPMTLAASACAGIGGLFAANMRHAGALRIDHVMGLSRLFWIPDGATPAAGAYVHYPLEVLTAVLALESARARCLVIGEDLGTVPEGFREHLASVDILSYRVLWFERDATGFIPPERYPPNAAACVSTHDLPTVAGWWTGADLDERSSLGQLGAEAVAAARDERNASKQALSEALDRAGVNRGAGIDPAMPHSSAVTAAIHRYAGATASALVLLQADDLAGETVALNLPGTDRERPNWRRRLRVDVAQLWRTAAGVEAVADFAATRAPQ